ncbi:hypothetical protein ZWY2020_043644 [Hordeum vulgare]|nr:hypothetical protein ZWY2020_043644 [Hordeum vulgare]
MAKRLVLFVAVIVALVALTTAEREINGNNIFLDSRSRQLQCERELQESSLEACRRVVDQQLVGQLPWSTGLQMQCCQQLRDVSPECRPVALSQVVRQYEQQTEVPSKGGSFYPGGTAPPLQQGGWWGTSVKWVSKPPSPHQGQQPGEQPCGFPGQQTTVSLHHGQQSNELYYGSPYHVSVEQPSASLKVAKAQQLAAQLPAMCRLEGGGGLLASQ